VNKKIHFLPGGLTVVFDREARVPELEKPWVELFAEFLESKGESPFDFELHFPDGKIGRIFRTHDGSWDWHFRPLI
jgi:hypothetical protein